LNSRRGQAFSADLIVGVMLSMLALGLLCAAWGLGKARLDETEHMRALEGKASAISDLVVKTPGDPPDWEDHPSDAVLIGLAREDRRLSDGKVLALEGIGGNRLREMFMLGGMGCAINIRTLEGSVVAGTGAPPYSDSVVTSARTVSYGNRTMSLEVSVWEDKPEALL